MSRRLSKLKEKNWRIFVDENYFAIENVCPHAYALLTEGFIEDQTVECPLHEAILTFRQVS